MKNQNILNWRIYILLCKDNSFYTGITTDVTRRVKQHSEGKGAKYTRAKGVKGLLWQSEAVNKRTAMKLERWIKSFTRERKENLIKGLIGRDEWNF